MKAILYLKMKKKLHAISPIIEVPDGISFFDAPVEVIIMPKEPDSYGQTIPQRLRRPMRFTRITGMEEILGHGTFVFNAPDNMIDAAIMGKP